MGAVDRALANLEPSLRLQVIDLLSRLQLLPEAQAQSLQPSVRSGKAEDRPPKGVGRTASDGTPSADVSLWAHYSFRFGRAALTNNEVEVSRLLVEADRAYQDFIKRPDNNRIAMQQERTEARDIEILLKYGENKHAAVLSAEYLWPIGWVRVVRERNGCDPEWGIPRPVWKTMSDEERYNCVAELAPKNTQKEIAMRLGISQASVSRYLRRKAA